MPSFDIQPLDFETELGAYARVRSMIDQEEISEDLVRERWANFKELRQEILVAKVDGAIVGASRWARFDHEPPHLFQIQVGVFPEHRRQGVARALFAAIRARAEADGAQTLMSGSYEDETGATAFAVEVGFTQKVQYHDSEIQLPVDLPNWSPPMGVDFEVISVTGASDPRLEELYPAYAEADADEPLTSETGVPNRETWVRFWDLPDYQQGLMAIARIQGEIVGLSHTAFNNGRMDTGFTGVVRSARGRGIAKALKVLLLQAESKRGTTKIITANSTLNTAMLAINKALGFTITKTWTVWEQHLSV